MLRFQFQPPVVEDHQVHHGHDGGVGQGGTDVGQGHVVGEQAVGGTDQGAESAPDLGGAVETEGRDQEVEAEEDDAEVADVVAVEVTVDVTFDRAHAGSAFLVGPEGRWIRACCCFRLGSAPSLLGDVQRFNTVESYF